VLGTIAIGLGIDDGRKASIPAASAASQSS
jgi:hypothetical protein